MLRPLVLQNCYSDKPEFHAEVQNHEVSSPFPVLALYMFYAKLMTAVKCVSFTGE